MSKVIKIHTECGGHDCETCGYNYGEGILVTLGDKVLYEVVCSSSCFSFTHVDYEIVLKEVLNSLGYEVEYSHEGLPFNEEEYYEE